MKKNILILKDDRTGNFRQAQAVANIVTSCLKKQGVESKIDIQEIEFKGKFAKAALIFYTAMVAKFWRHDCLNGLKIFLKQEAYKALLTKKPDVIISGGAAVALVNVVLSRETHAKSIAVMKPSTVNLKRFDLVITPRHDNLPHRKNIVVTEGALNLVDRDYLEKHTEKLHSSSVIDSLSSVLRIGLLIGGDAKAFHLAPEMISEIIKQIKSVSQDLDADILVTTSRRTSSYIEKLIKKEFEGYDRCKLLVVANEKNIPEAVGAILGLSDIIVISPESIMMISEAVNSEKYVLVFESRGLSKKHRAFLQNYAKNKYIYLTSPLNLGQTIKDIRLNKPQAYAPSKDKFLIAEALNKIL